MDYRKSPFSSGEKANGYLIKHQKAILARWQTAISK